METSKNSDIRHELIATVSAPKPADSPIGSPASRAAVRAMFENLPTSPPFVVHFVGDKGEVLPSDEGRVDEQTIWRLPSEKADFQKRLLSMAPRTRPALIVMFSSANQTEIECGARRT